MASDRARYFLEQYVPELQEYERKEIFSPEEIRAIAGKRSDFEHTINARGSKPGDYARYATYEMNLDRLRKKRCQRMGVKSTTFRGQRTIFFILDRATKKFPVDMGLWMQYINYCQREKANKKLTKVLTRVLRLKPRDWGLWVLAAKYFAEVQGDMSAARSYMQRGLRFCKDERKLWLEYLKLEMVYLAKLAARRKILGLDEQNDGVEQGEDKDQDMAEAHTTTAEDIDPDTRKGIDEVDDDALKKLAATPAFTGAIPSAIFDSAMKQFSNDSDFAEAAFDLCATFDKVPSSKQILRHILRHLQDHSSDSVEFVMCEAKLQVFGLSPNSEYYPSALGSSLSTIKIAQSTSGPKAVPRIAEKTTLWLITFLRAKEEIDEDVAKVLEVTVRRNLKLLQQRDNSNVHRSSPDAISALMNKLRKDDRDTDVDILQSLTGYG